VGADGPDADDENDAAQMDPTPTMKMTLMIWETSKRASPRGDQDNRASSGEGVVQDDPCDEVERPPMTMREMFPHVDDLGATPRVAQVPQIPTFLHRLTTSGRDAPLDVDDPNATPDGNDSDEEDPAPLIDSEDEDDDRLRNRSCNNYEDDADEEDAEIVVHDDEAQSDEEFEVTGRHRGARHPRACL
jgi:hypothetical protein